MSKIQSIDDILDVINSGTLPEEFVNMAKEGLCKITQLVLEDEEDDLAKFIFMKAVSIGVKPETLADFLDIAETIQPGSSISIMIPYIAEYFNKKRIQECEAYNYVSYFYGISKRNGEVTKFENNDIKRRDIGGWFISYEDAKKTREMFDSILNDIYGKQQED